MVGKTNTKKPHKPAQRHARKKGGSVNVLGQGDDGCVLQYDNSGYVYKLVARPQVFQQELNNMQALHGNNVDTDQQYLLYPVAFEGVARTPEVDQQLFTLCPDLRSAILHFNPPLVYKLKMKHGGISLDTLAQQPDFIPFTFEEAQKLLTDVATGLRLMHAKGFAHKDLHDRNVTISNIDVTDRANLRAYIIDFGQNVQDDAAKTGRARDEENFVDIIYTKIRSMTERISQKRMPMKKHINSMDDIFNKLSNPPSFSPSPMRVATNRKKLSFADSMVSSPEDIPVIPSRLQFGSPASPSSARPSSSPIKPRRLIAMDDNPSPPSAPKKTARRNMFSPSNE